jgi:hypothetical protein
MVQGFRVQGSRVQRFKGSRVQGSRVQGFKGSRENKNLVSGIQQQFFLLTPEKFHLPVFLSFFFS